MDYDISSDLHRPAFEKKPEFKESKPVFEENRNLINEQNKFANELYNHFGGNLDKNQFAEKINETLLDEKKFDELPEHIRKELKETRQDLIKRQKQEKELNELKKQSTITTAQEFGSVSHKMRNFFDTLEMKFREITGTAAKKFCDDKKFHTEKEKLKINFNLLKKNSKAYVSFIAKEVISALKDLPFDANPYLGKVYSSYAEQMSADLEDELTKYVQLKPEYAEPSSIMDYLDYNVSSQLSQIMASERGLKGITDKNIYHSLESQLAKEGLGNMRSAYVTQMALNRKHPSFFDNVQVKEYNVQEEDEEINPKIHKFPKRKIDENKEYQKAA